MFDSVGWHIFNDLEYNHASTVNPQAFARLVAVVFCPRVPLLPFSGEFSLAILIQLQHVGEIWHHSTWKWPANDAQLYTPLKTNTYRTLNIGGWFRWNFLSTWSLFRGHVNFRWGLGSQSKWTRPKHYFIVDQILAQAEMLNVEDHLKILSSDLLRLRICCGSYPFIWFCSVCKLPFKNLLLSWDVEQQEVKQQVILFWYTTTTHVWGSKSHHMTHESLMTLWMRLMRLESWQRKRGCTACFNIRHSLLENISRHIMGSYGIPTKNPRWSFSMDRMAISRLVETQNSTWIVEGLDIKMVVWNHHLK